MSFKKRNRCLKSFDPFTDLLFRKRYSGAQTCLVVEADVGVGDLGVPAEVEGHLRVARVQVPRFGNLHLYFLTSESLTSLSNVEENWLLLFFRKRNHLWLRWLWLATDRV